MACPRCHRPAVFTTTVLFSKPVATGRALNLADRIPERASIAEIRRLFGKSPQVDLYHDPGASWSRKSEGLIRERCFIRNTCLSTTGHSEKADYYHLSPLFFFCSSDIIVEVYFQRDADPKLAPYPGAPNHAIGWQVRSARSCL